MPTKWSGTRNVGNEGTVQVVVHAPGQPKVDVTYLRNVPVSIPSWTHADPFGPATCQLVFNQITPFDDIGQGDLNWCRDFADIDIYMVPPSYASLPNMLTDGGFELSNGGAVSLNSATINWQSQVTHTGTHALQITTPGSITTEGVQNLGQVNASIGIGDSWTVGAWVLAPVGMRLMIEIRYGQVGTNNPETHDSHNYTGTGTWQWITVTAAAASSCSNLTVKIFTSYSPSAPQAGTFYVDDLYVAHTAAANDSRVKVWEGFIASFDLAATEDSYNLTVTGKGALYQLDNYVAPPNYPQRPVAYEVQIQKFLDKHTRPNLRTAPLQVVFPNNWKTTVPTDIPQSSLYYVGTGLKPGTNWTGFASRSTGSWDKALSSYITNMLQVMVVDDSPGDAWTLLCTTGRQPVLQVRQMNTAPSYSVWAGQPGVSLQLSRDLSQFANVFYGEGTDMQGVQWKRQRISNDGTWTDYEPIAADTRVYPDHGNNEWYDNSIMRSETYQQFDNGYDEAQAVDAAKTLLRRDEDPGWVGTITLNIDPLDGTGATTKSRYEMQAGVPILLKGFMGTGATGMKFHIAEVDVNVDDGTVDLKVDTKFRDLLTVEDALARTRDPLTPLRMLQVNRRSIVIEDAEAPWSYHAGSGFLPKESIKFYGNMPAGQYFPFTAQAKKYPPKKYPHYYVRVQAHGGRNGNNRFIRWTFPTILASAKGTIRKTQIAAYDRDGNQIDVPFHFSVYNVTVTADDMPFDQHGPSPYIANAFQSTDQYGNPIPPETAGISTLPQSSLIVGWGTGSQPAGYSPGSKSAGDPCTGLLIDETPWQYDFTNAEPFLKYLQKGQHEPTAAITLFGAFYAEWTEDVFFMGRLFHEDSGTVR